MMKTSFSRLLRSVALMLALATTGQAMADVVLHVSIDTSKYAVNTGFLDFQFAGAGVAQPPASVTMWQLTGFDAAQFTQEGDVTALAGGYRMGNTPGWNDLLYGASFGGVFGFNLTFAGDAIDTASSTFSVQALDANFGQLGLTPEILTLEWKLLPSGKPDAVTTLIDTQVVSVSAVPEPSSIAMLGLGLAMLGFAARKKAAK